MLNQKVAFLQIRMKHTPVRVYYEEAKKLSREARRRKIPLIINDRVDVALCLGASGVHVGQEDLPPMEAKKILGQDSWIGLSCHTQKEVDEALEDPAVDYLAVGPIYPTPFKERKPVGFSLLVYARGKGKPVVAIGGITPATIPEVLAHGADFVAMIRGLWQ